MNREDIERINAATLKRLGENAADLDASKDRYYGFYTVDIFESPPFVMFTAADCPRAADILYARSFETMSMKIWCRLAAIATGIFDVGAHVGVYSLAAAAIRPNLTIHAFEPNPYAFARLRMHKTVNGFGNITEHQYALTDRTGVSPLQWVEKPGLPISSGGSVLSRDPHGTERVTIENRRLDDLPAASDIGIRGLIKIDVEGAEEFTVKGMQTVVTKKPDIILESFSPHACDEINAITAPLGYRSYLIRERECDVIAQEKLAPRSSTADKNFNQFLTVRPAAEIDAILL